MPSRPHEVRAHGEVKTQLPSLGGIHSYSTQASGDPTVGRDKCCDGCTIPKICWTHLTTRILKLF